MLVHVCACLCTCVRACVQTFLSKDTPTVEHGASMLDWVALGGACTSMPQFLPMEMVVVEGLDYKGLSNIFFLTVSLFSKQFSVKSI